MKRMLDRVLKSCVLGIVLFLPLQLLAQEAVKMYEEPLVLPTYKVGPADKNPIFYTDRAYQGAKGEVYPYPLQDNLTDDKVDKAWQGLFLENEFIKIAILPEMGGKLWYAIDKTNGYDFIYYNEQVKPALIGMLGAWTSGGLEWNIPHHHRASTYMSIDYEMVENEDGSKTIWVGEIERRHRMKWRVGYTLYPGKSYLETTIKLYNRTTLEHSFLIFANTAVHANEQYQVIFPPSTQYGTSHSKTTFTEWPISRQQYGAREEGKSVDVSWWKNHPTPISIFDFGQGDFVAGYDHGQDSGTLIVGNPHIMTGRKFFEWGPGPAGSMWDDILTDTSGPYLELMAGAYSDNQPDYSWVNPTMVKSAKMYFSPLRNIRDVKKANIDAALNLEVSDGQALLGVNTTQQFSESSVILRAGDEVIYREEKTISPNTPFYAEINLPGEIDTYDLSLHLEDVNGQEVIAYQPKNFRKKPMPETVSPPELPGEITTVEQLYREGLRLEQFYNPTLDPMQYYEEALRRDPNHSLVNTQLGLYYLKRGNFDLAETHLRTAVETVTQDYTAPKNAESLYYLGVTLFKQGDKNKAYDWLYKSTWDMAWYAPAYYLLAQIDISNGDYRKALTHLDRSISTNMLNNNALNLKSVVLRKLGRMNEVIEIAEKVTQDDPLNAWASNELYLASGNDEVLRALNHQMQDDVESYLELAVDYGNAGLFEEAISILNRAKNNGRPEINSYPMVYYYRGYYYEKLGEDDEASQSYEIAANMPSDFCFPYRFESADVLEAALQRNPDDAMAHYYLGNLYYDNIPERAVDEWQNSISIDDSFAIAHRNLAFAYAHIRGENEKAIQSMERALELNPDDPRYYAELDRYYENAGTSPEKRLANLEENHEIVKKDDSALAGEIGLLIFHGRFNKAIKILSEHRFRKVEGVGNIHNHWVDAHLLRGQEFLENGMYEEAMNDFKEALTYPRNLEVGAGNREGEVYFFIAEAFEAMGQPDMAEEYYRKSTESHYGWNEMKYRQALAYEKIGKSEEASDIYSGLIDRGQEMLSGDRRTDFFEKFSGDQNENARLASAHYLIGLGEMGLGNQENARTRFERTLELNPAHLGAKMMMKSGNNKS
ncbi:MAG: DUF5107 domain-containing protein [Bacteroidetes bacterium]|jgi:tetratricopeptide (TPR) repeat protein|nr:DUF5107 domain-containing protein [Bacteroidota bacterium]